MPTAPVYAIAELAADSTGGGGFAPRGAVKELWTRKEREIMVSGPAETGKTYGCLQYLDALMWKYPGAQGVIARKTQSSIYGTVLQTYKRIVAPDGYDRSPIMPYGGEKPEWFDYPNGSRVWVAGLDNPQKALSSERDVIYVNQSEDLDVADWETLSTRATGRAGNMPYAKLFGDCNPGPPTHWILHRPQLTVLRSYHEDNPTLFDDAGNITEQGTITLAVLDGLTGVRKERLRHGRWVQAEGTVYEGYDARIHVVKQREIPADWPRYWDVDFGFTNPFVWQAWALDGDGRMLRYKELYLTQMLVEDAAALIMRATLNEPRPREIICDHDAEDRRTFEKHNVYCATCHKAIREGDMPLHAGHAMTRFNLETKPAYKAVSPGIQAVASRLKVADDGKPRLMFMEGALIHPPDPNLIAAKKPTCTEQEMETYIWDTSSGRRSGEEPLKKDDHGVDGTRYMVARIDQIHMRKGTVRFRPYVL